MTNFGDSVRAVISTPHHSSFRLGTQPWRVITRSEEYYSLNVNIRNILYVTLLVKISLEHTLILLVKIYMGSLERIHLTATYYVNVIEYFWIVYFLCFILLTAFLEFL